MRLKMPKNPRGVVLLFTVSLRTINICPMIRTRPAIKQEEERILMMEIEDPEIKTEITANKSPRNKKELYMMESSLNFILSL